MVQYVVTHRVAEAHMWIMADRGKLVRAYGMADRAALFDRGEHTAAENELRVDFNLDEDEPRSVEMNPEAHRAWLNRQIDEETGHASVVTMERRHSDVESATFAARLARNLHTRRTIHRCVVAMRTWQCLVGRAAGPG